MLLHVVLQPISSLYCMEDSNEDVLSNEREKALGVIPPGALAGRVSKLAAPALAIDTGSPDRRHLCHIECRLI